MQKARRQSSLTAGAVVLLVAYFGLCAAQGSPPETTSLPDIYELNERLRQTHSSSSSFSSFSSPTHLSTFTPDGSSSCSADHGCPLSSMVWASGTFTIGEMLTPASFFVASNLTLKLSLCCGYKYNGALLRNQTLYDTFLRVLLQASPFHVLTAEEKRNMFPRERAVIVDNVHQRRYDAAYVPTEEDVQRENDGDGDVIVLVSGAVGDGIYRIPLHSTTEGLSTAIPADIHLKIANVVLKCKCPHTLLVMPMLRVRHDTLAPVSILGLGSHCGQRSGTSTRPGLSENSSSTIVRLRDKAWAVSFAVSPPQLPATLVRWVVTEKTTAKVVLDELFHTVWETGSTAAALRRHANCSYFKMLPNRMYEVLVTVSRGAVTQTASGFFIMRLPLDKDRAIKFVTPQPHFGFERHLKVSKDTLNHPQLRDALATAQYFGYWENTPFYDQPLPQTLRRVRHNPFTEDAVSYPLFLGRNNVSFYVSDVDEVCDPTLLEVQELWALQGILLQPSVSPTTVCRDDVMVEALSLKSVVSELRSSRQLPVQFAGASLGPGRELDVAEGRFECAERGAGVCHIRAADAGGGTSGVLQVRRRGVAELSWVARVEVGDAALVTPECIDPAVARVVGGPAGDQTGAAAVVEVRSRVAVVVRRISAMPESVDVTLPTSLRRLTVRPPQSLDAAGGDVPHGHWIVAAPLDLVSVSDALEAEIDTSRVPNLQQTLQPGTLQFVAEDPGEAIDLGVPYTSRCPPRLVEHRVTVVPVAAVPIVPAFVPVYTEDDCVRLRAPRGPFKDEETQWHIPYCSEATQPPHIVQRQTREEQRQDHLSQQEDQSTVTEEVTVCGIEAYLWCNVIWTARNPAGAVTQTFSLRRCQRPPKLLFHKDGLQTSRSIPYTVYELPSIEWLIGYEGDGDDIGDNDADSSFSEAGKALSRPRYTTRRVIPVAGFDAVLGYSFNYTASQQDFEADFTYMHVAAHQLRITQRHFERAGLDNKDDDVGAAAAATPLRLRRFVCSLDGGHNHSDKNIRINDTNITVTENAHHTRKENVQSIRKTFQRDKRIDMELDARFSLTHHTEARRLQVSGLSNSSHYPFFYEVKVSPSAAHLGREAEEFARRGMCVRRRGDVSVFALNPRGVISVGAGDVLPFCHASYEFSRHPWLHTKYHFDFLWSCEDAGVMTVERRTPTFSVFYHNGHANETRCRLTVRNTLTDTQESEQFVMRRVHPTTMPQNFVLLGDNAADGNCLVNDTTRLEQGRTTTTTVSDSRMDGGVRRKSTTRWVVGKSIVLHVDAPVGAENSQWRALSVVPEVALSVGTRVVLDSIHFVPLLPNARATTEEESSRRASVLVQDIRVPGLYTFGYYHPDPVYPGICPNVSVVETLHVVHAQITEKELTVCGDSQMLRAVPIPREIECQFVGQWEVVSLQTSVNETWTDKSSFAGIRFEHDNQPRTSVHGLPFGIVTLRWAIYAVSPKDHEGSGETQQKHRPQGRVLVDHDTVRLYVLTDNLQSNRLVTLSDTVQIFSTSSTTEWALKTPEVSSSPLLSRGPHLRIETVSKKTHDIGDSTENGVGHEAVILTNLPIGITNLQYTLYPSLRAFGSMLLKKCPIMRQQLFVVERVSAFLSANTTLDHECDAYSGRGRLSICLHAEGTQDTVGVAPSSLSSSSISFASLLGATLIAPERLEAVVKAGAARLEAHGCSLPWWVHRTTRWFDVRADADRRCVSFGVAATRHLKSAEVSHFIFSTQERLGSTTVCSRGGDFMTSEIIEGASTWSDGDNDNDNAAVAARRSGFRGGDILQFLPFLHPVSLARDERSMRPMLSLLGVPDVVAPELNISDDANAVTVVLRLDTTQPRQMGGFPHATYTPRGHHGERRDSLLTKCVRDTLRASDVLQFWTEVNQPDGAEGRTAKEWLEYIEAVREKRVLCEPLFASLSHLMLRPDDTDATLRSRRAQRVPPKEQRLVSLSVIEQQLVGLKRDFRWTREGIDVTGLRADLQAALLRRRITKSQLEEIEEARRQQGVKQQDKLQLQPELGDASANLTREKLFERVLRLYKGVFDEDVAAIRLTLPRYKPFSVPHNLFLRTAVHKDVVCGTNISAIGAVDSLVLFGRVEVVDLPPLVGVTPAAIKQCEVEGGIPVIHINVSGLTFRQLDPFPTSRVFLEEIHNPNRTGALASSSDVGLAPCLEKMRTGMQVTLSSVTHKQLELRLSPCPFFQMLSSADYNEEQNSELLLGELLLPRLLRVTLRDVLAEDSHTRGKTSVSFLLEVRPTLARLHLRPLLSRESMVVSSTATSWSEPASRRPLLMCEADVRRRGVELGVELIGDKWHELVGEMEIDDDDDNDGVDGGMNLDETPLYSPMVHAPDDSRTDFSLQSSWTDQRNAAGYNGNIIAGARGGGGGGGGGVRRRLPHNIALINSFSIVERHRFDSIHHLFLRHGGVYRSHFISYLFSVMANSKNIRQHKFVHRYNDTFVSVRIPAEPRSLDGLFYNGGNDVRLEKEDHLPPIRVFSTIEEILFAVPGIATECRGCLLADTTYFVAGDLTGLWSFPPATPPASLSSAVLVEPLRVPFHAAPHVPRQWRFTTLCPAAAWDQLRHFWEHWRPPRTSHDDQSFLQMELVVYSLRDMLGGEVPLSKRSTVVLSSVPLALGDVLTGDQGKARNILEIVFKVNASAAERAHAMMAADFARYGRRHLHTVHDYVQDDSGNGVALAVNASVFLKLCVPPTAAVPETQCSILSLTHSLLLMEQPRVASYYGQLRSGSLGSILSPAAVLHHAGSALVGHIILLQLPLAVRRAIAVGRTRDATSTRTGLTVVLFVAMLFFYRMAPRLWAVMWTLLWAVLFSLLPDVMVGVYYVLHFLFWAFVM